ncbi:MAG: preprotein translocase subunit SecE [Myxococcales bacterium]|nr:preprotein translocase subunit SecE [Myxococcales bacterium]
MSTIAEEQGKQSAAVLGIERWVQFAFIGGAFGLFWLLNHAIFGAWDTLADYADLASDPSDTWSTAAAAVLAVVTGIVLYRHPKTSRFANLVASELSKVTWPTRQETWAQTIVVVVVSVIAAVILGVFDAGWSALTDLIYKV